MRKSAFSCNNATNLHIFGASSENLLFHVIMRNNASNIRFLVQICCIITWKSRFSHDAPKTRLFDALIRGKAGFLMTRPKTKCTFEELLRFVAGFLMTRQKLIYLMHYYLEKQVFS